MGRGPGFGALGAVFMALRLLLVVALVSVIGLAGGFVRGMVREGVVVSSAVVGTLVVACIATTYTLITSFLHRTHLLPLLIATAADTTLSIALIISSCILGKPVHNLSCKKLPSHGNTGTGTFISSLFTSSVVIDPSKAACHSIKATWALCITSAILFAASAIVAISLWNNVKRRAAQRPRKGIDCE